MSALKASDFVAQWIADHIGAGTLDSELPELVKLCEEEARNAGISTIKLLDETGSDIRTMIEEAKARERSVNEAH